MFPRLTDGADRARRAGRSRAPLHAGEILFEQGERHPQVLRRARRRARGRSSAATPERPSSCTSRASSPARSACSPAVARSCGPCARGGAACSRSTAPAARDRRRRDAELSELLLRAFILRRVGADRAGHGDVVLVGSRHSAGTLRRAGVPDPQRSPVPYDGRRDAIGGAGAARRFHVGVAEVPIVICRGSACSRTRPTTRSPSAWG